MTYHALEWEVSRRFGDGVYFQSNFNWKKTLLDVFEGSEENGLTPTDSYNCVLHRARADSSEPIIFDRQRCLGTPLRPCKKFANLGDGTGNSILNQIIGGWRISGLFLASAGQIFTPTYAGFDSTGTGISTGRADAECNDQSQKDDTHWFDHNCYLIPSSTGDATGQPLGRFGNAARGSLRGPGILGGGDGGVQGFSTVLEGRLLSPSRGFPLTSTIPPTIRIKEDCSAAIPTSPAELLEVVPRAQRPFG